MKCPKCGYLGFEASERCRHCGFDFSIAPPAPSGGASVTAGDLALRDRGERADEGPLGDFPLREGRPLPPAPTTFGAGAAAPHETGQAGDLPLFWAPPDPGEDETPLITRPSPPRAPLVVRRATPEVPRGRFEATRTPPLDWLSPTATPVGEPSGPGASAVPPPMSPAAPSPAHAHPPLDAARTAGAVSPGVPGPTLVFADAPMSARLVAVVVDLLLLAGVDAVVIYLTVRIGGLSFADFRLLPLGPLLAFFVVQNGGYLVAFTSGGQTLGKMAAGIRVVVANGGGPVDIGRALRRTIGWALLAAPCGLGFLTAVFAGDKRGLHDRWAGTRVVRAVPANAAMLR